MKIDQFRFPPDDKKKRLIPVIVSILFFFLISCSFSNPLALFLPTSTNTPTRTYTPSPTSTSSPTHTPSSTPTESLSPTPKPPRFEVQTRTDNSNLVMDLTCGYQFVLPNVWTMPATFSKSRFSQVVAKTPRNNGDWLFPNLTMEISLFLKEMETLELELYHYTTGKLGPMDSILSQVLTTNPYGTALGTLKLREMASSGYIPGDGNSNQVLFNPGSMKNKNDIKPLMGPSYYETYEVLFYCDKFVIVFKFSGITHKNDSFTSSDMQLMYTVQNSIQFK